MLQPLDSNSRPAHVKGRDDDAVLREPRVEGHQVAQAASEQQRAGDEHQGERNLQDDEAAPEPESFARVGGAAAGRSHSGAGRRTGGADGRHQAEQHAGDDRERRREREDPPVERQRNEHPVGLGGKKINERLTEPLRQHRAADGPAGSNQQALGEHLTHDACSRRADGETNRDFALAGGCPGEHQVRQVGAGNQQDERARRQQQPQRRLVAAAQL